MPDITLNKMNKAALLILSALLAGVIGVFRYFTGPELALSLFYLFAIVFVTWWMGRLPGIFISIFSALSWLTADMLMLDSFSESYIPYINECFRLIVFLFITIIIDRLKGSVASHKELARTDHLTGIANRRAFCEMADMEINKARRNQTSISMVYMDIDNFKIVNDRFGHLAGDNLLQSTARIMKNNIRTIDLIARLGGDEFCLLLSETDAEQALLVARKLERKLLHMSTDDHLPISFSFGVVTYNDPPDCVEAMIKEADYQMYLAKQDGKKRTRSKVIANRQIRLNSLEAA